MSTADVVKAVEVLEAERAIETVKLRNKLVKACAELLATAIEQAKPQGKKPGSAALLRLISRIAMRPTQIERRRK
jgi:hypothetical protein